MDKMLAMRAAHDQATAEIRRLVAEMGNDVGVIAMLIDVMKYHPRQEVEFLHSEIAAGEKGAENFVQLIGSCAGVAIAGGIMSNAGAA